MRVDYLFGWGVSYMFFKRFFLFCLSLGLVLLVATGAYGKPVPAFTAEISTIPPQIAAHMKQYTWHEGCPLGFNQLAYLRLLYWGFDQVPHQGELIVNKKLAAEVVGIFKVLYAEHFPIERMQLMDVFKGNDDAAMAVNNTSAFNCRDKTNQPGKFSLHSYGVAVDINTLINPYVKGDQVLPAGGRKYLDRTKRVPGMIVKNGFVYKLFIRRGWHWGGDWDTRQDYQHFEKPEVVK
jgi:hypothetical protein